VKTKDWIPPKPAKALVIGHDPRLRKSDTIAEYVLFANYYFQGEPTRPHDKQKYGLAKLTFDHISFLTAGKINPDEIYLTNLCKSALDRPSRGIVLIPRAKAIEGLKNIKETLSNNPSIEFIFAMSLQVNYWLQELGFYKSENNFFQKTLPVKAGLMSDPPYFKPKTARTFIMICGNHYKLTEGDQLLFPVLHSKMYPLKGNILSAYGDGYERIRELFRGI
jgi:hypothetical protein